MKTLLADLLAHQAWADAEHWRVIVEHDALRADEEIRARVHHYSLTMHAFAALVQDRRIEIRKLEEFPAVDDLAAYNRAGHRALAEALGTIAPDTFFEKIAVPWFRNPPLIVTRHEALLQSALHAQHHRGQNALRMRVLGVAPPLTDHIAWVWKGRPEVQE
jgi:uncharacterized damage-inducible protein DinB